MKKIGLIIVMVLIIGGLSLFIREVFGAEKKVKTPAAGKEMSLGEKVYGAHCAVCHGTKGDGKGPGTALMWREKNNQLLNVQARDFTIGVFKFRSTPTGCLPTDADLLHTVTEGIPKSFMPSHKGLSLAERKAVIEYIKTFSKRWKEEEPCQTFSVRKPDWVGTLASAEKGKKVYKDMKCWECHGDRGEGDGPKADKLKDDWGQRIFPFDFTTGDLKRGTSPENIYLAYTTGLDGTGMPSYEDSLSEEDRWHLVSYTLQLMDLGLIESMAALEKK